MKKFEYIPITKSLRKEVEAKREHLNSEEYQTAIELSVNINSIVFECFNKVNELNESRIKKKVGSDLSEETCENSLKELINKEILIISNEKPKTYKLTNFGEKVMDDYKKNKEF